MSQKMSKLKTYFKFETMMWMPHNYQLSSVSQYIFRSNLDGSKISVNIFRFSLLSGFILTYTVPSLSIDLLNIDY